MNRDSHPPSSPQPAPKPTGPVGPGRDERATATAVFLIFVGVILAAFLLACGMGEASGQSCTNPGPKDGPSPSWSFKCEVKP